MARDRVLVDLIVIGPGAKPYLAARPQHGGEGVAQLAMHQQGSAGHQMRGELLPERMRGSKIRPQGIELLGDGLPEREQGLAFGEQPVALLDQLACSAEAHLMPAQSFAGVVGAGSSRIGIGQDGGIPAAALHRFECRQSLLLYNFRGLRIRHRSRRLWLWGLRRRRRGAEET